LVELAHTFAVAVVVSAETHLTGAVCAIITVKTEAAAVAAQTVVGAVSWTCVVYHHLLALGPIKTGVADTLAQVADTTEHAVVFAYVLGFAALARETEVAETVAVLTHTVFARFAAAVVDRTVGTGVTRSAVALLGWAVADTTPPTFLAIDLVLGAGLQHAAVVTLVLQVAPALAVQHALAAGGAVVGALDLAALAGETFFAHANTVRTGALAVATLEAAHLRAVVAGEAVVALALAA
jgi:hypothetical protein